MERLQDRFSAANTVVLGISVDSKFCHAGWAQSLGGISFPLLADFQPKGATARAYGLFLDEPGITDRATVIIDADGVVRHASSVGPGGSRDIAELAALCEEVNGAYEGDLPATQAPAGIGEATLYVKGNCGFSAWTLQARANLGLTDSLPVRNVSDDPAAMEALKAATGKEQAPCLMTNGEAMLESADIIKYLVGKTTSL